MRKMFCAVGVTAAIIWSCMEYQSVNPFDPKFSGSKDPFTLVAVSDTSAIRLSWNRMQLIDVEKFLIYRSKDSIGGMSVVREIGDERVSSFVDGNVIEDSTYWYAISMVAGGRESSRSSLVFSKAIAPAKPQLRLEYNSLAADTIDFSVNHNSLQVLVSSIGAANLTVDKVQSSAGWISFIAPDQNMIAPGKNAVLTIRVHRDSLVARDAPYFGSLVITSDGGSWKLAIRVVESANRPILVVAADTLHFDSAKTLLQLKIRNDGNAVMKGCSLSTSQQWISVAPAKITGLAVGDEFGFEVNVLRNHQSVSVGKNTGLISILSDGGNGFVAVSAIKQASISPVLAVKYDTLDFGDDKTRIIQVISNVGIGTLNWQIAAPGEKWLRLLGPSSGTLNADSSIAVELEILRDSIQPGSYQQILNVASNCCNTSFAVMVRKKETVPPAAAVLTAAAVSPSSVSLRWTSNGEEQFTEYVLYRSRYETVDDRDTRVFSGTLQSDTMISDTTVESLTCYYYRVYTIGGEGRKTPSNTLIVCTPALRTLKGITRNRATNAVLGGIRVNIIGRSDSILCGIDGSYRFENPAPGSAIVRFSKTGFLFAADTVTIPGKDSAVLNISLATIPHRKTVGSSILFTDPGDIAVINSHIFVLERDWQLPRVVAIGTATGEQAASINLKSYCETVGKIVCEGNDVYVSCPGEKKLLKISNALGGASIASLQLDFAPYGMCVKGTDLVVAGKGTGTDGFCAVIRRSDFYKINQFTIAAFGAELDLANASFGPQISATDQYAYIGNGSRSTGAVASVDLSDGTVKKVNLRWPRVSGISFRDETLLVSSSHTEADSILCFSPTLEPRKGMHSGIPVQGAVYAGESGMFGRMIIAAGSGISQQKKQLVFLHDILGQSAGSVLFENDLVASALSPDGRFVAVITGNAVDVVGY